MKRTLKNKINLQLVLIALLAILFTVGSSIFIFYGFFEKQVIADLECDAHILQKSNIYDSNDGDYEEIYSPYIDKLRITIIDIEGNVLYDSEENSKSMENHSNRPEIIEALNDGEGHAIRRSVTRDKDTFYVAVPLKNDCVLRVAKEASNINSLVKKVIPITIIIIISLIIICIILAHYFTKSIVDPIEELSKDIDQLPSNAAYKELQPFITRIRKQHEDILKSVMVRQEFTANVSHELKTPLTAISGYSEIIQNKMASEDEIVRFAEQINKSSKRLLMLINDIIKISEIDCDDLEVQFNKVNLNVAAIKCVQSLQMNAQKHKISLDVSGNDCYIYGNLELINEIIYNLTDNAIRYNNQGGKVQVRVYCNKNDSILEVKDNGIGISKENQDRIFERFYRVDKSRSKRTGGTGLGLAIVKHIVAKHDAKIEIESKEGVGTSIKIIFKRLF